jgi:hypothetical protein
VPAHSGAGLGSPRARGARQVRATDAAILGSVTSVARSVDQRVAERAVKKGFELDHVIQAILSIDELDGARRPTRGRGRTSHGASLAGDEGGDDEEAMISTRLDSVLHWLLLHLREDDLPAEYQVKGRIIDVIVKPSSSSAASQSTGGRFGWSLLATSRAATCRRPPGARGTHTLWLRAGRLGAGARSESANRRCLRRSRRWSLDARVGAILLETAR